MMKIALIVALVTPMLTGCIQAGTILINANANIPDSALKDAAGTVKNLAKADATFDQAADQPTDLSSDRKVDSPTDTVLQPDNPADQVNPVTYVKRKVSGVVRRPSGKTSDDLMVVITLRSMFASSAPAQAMAPVAPDGSFEVEMVNGDYFLFVTKKGDGANFLLPDNDGFVKLGFLKNSLELAPRIDLSISKDLEVTVGFALITVPEELDNI